MSYERLVSLNFTLFSLFACFRSSNQELEANKQETQLLRHHMYVMAAPNGIGLPRGCAEGDDSGEFLAHYVLAVVLVSLSNLASQKQYTEYVPHE